MDIKRFGTDEQILARYNRVIDPVPAGGNCMFDAVARQCPEPHITMHTLRQLACDYGERHKDEFKPFFIYGDYDTYLAEFRKDRVWNMHFGDLLPLMIMGALGEDKHMAIVRSGNEVYHFNAPKGSPITSDTIVIVHDISQSHYDASKVIGEGPKDWRKKVPAPTDPANLTFVLPTKECPGSVDPDLFANLRISDQSKGRCVISE